MGWISVKTKTKQTQKKGGGAERCLALNAASAGLPLRSGRLFEEEGVLLGAEILQNLVSLLRSEGGVAFELVLREKLAYSNQVLPKKDCLSQTGKRDQNKTSNR